MSDTPTSDNCFAVFPLNTVLLPGCVLPLRIFEARYLDMVSASLRDQRPFIIVKAHGEGKERSRHSAPEDAHKELHFYPTGCEAEVIDFDRGSDGVLSIIVKGQSRVSLSSVHQQRDGLWMADTERLPEWGAMADDRLSRLRDLLDQLLQHDHTKRLLNWISLDDQEAVMNHLVMLLPLATSMKQALLEADDLGIRWQGIEDAIERLEAQGGK